MYTESEVGQGMTRKELIFFAREHGYEISEDQVERWHKKGIIPSPDRQTSTGSVGSVWDYPSGAENNLLLALTSTESKRSLDKILLDVWLRGGKIDYERIRKLLLDGWLKNIGKFLKSLGNRTWIDKLEKIFYEAESKKKKNPLIYISFEDLQTTITLIINAFSTHIKDELWNDEAAQYLGEESSASIVEKSIGSDYLRSLDPIRKSDTPEIMLSDIKRLLNIQALQDAVSQATEEDFERARHDLPLLEVFIRFINHTSVSLDKTNAFYRFVRGLPIFPFMIRYMGLIVLLRYYQDEQANQWVIGFISHINNQIENMEAMTSFIEHMKKHPKLKKRMHWNQYLNQCDKNTFQSVKAHAEAYWNTHPDFVPSMEQFNRNLEVNQP